MSESQNKRIARNALMLYLRTFITVGIGLFTGRVVLQALGISDYGINTVVGGIIAFSGIIAGTMMGAINRFLTFALGEGNLEKQKEVFTTSVNAQLIMSTLTIIVLEVVGVWWLCNYAEIPDGRLGSAKVVLQLAILHLVANLLGCPYQASIVAHEDFKVFALCSVVDSTIRLITAYIVLYCSVDHLILMALFNTATSVVISLFQVIYSHTKYPETRYSWRLNRPLLKEMTSFSGWTMLGNFTWILNTQGINLLINMCFGVVFNATRGITMVISTHLQNFINSFITAFKPPIVKAYASGDINESNGLVLRSSRYTWYLTLLFVVPMAIEAPTLLSLWLVEVPPLAPLFLRLALIEIFLLSFQTPLLQLINATGKVKRYYIQETLLAAMVFPLTWLIYWIGLPVWSCYILSSAAYIFFLVIRLHNCGAFASFSAKRFLSVVFWPCSKVSILAFIAPIIIATYWPSSTLRFFVMVPLCLLSVLSTIYSIGLNEEERSYLMARLRFPSPIQVR